MQHQDIREKILDGTISSISVDTCIFDAAGLKLEQGVLKHLEQFKGSDIDLIFAEVTVREVTAHLSKKAEEALSALQKGLGDMGSYWQTSEARRSEIFKELSGAGDHRGQANDLIQAFLKRCGAKTLQAKSHVDMGHLLDRYFSPLPPFESGKKKHEFPDAIALMTLESWAKTAGKGVLLVTTDKGCADYCSASPHLFSIDDLGTALSLIQERNQHLSGLAEKIENQVAQGKHPELLDFITQKISDDIDSVDWYPEASSYYHFSGEMEDVCVGEVSFGSENNSLMLKPVNYSNGQLTFETTVAVRINASCCFSFAVRDSIDKDMVPVGHATVRTHDVIELDILLTAVNLHEDRINFTDAEVIPVSKEIDFGDIEPDYSDEDPNYEKY
jgi:hypothetical protein